MNKTLALTACAAALTPAHAAIIVTAPTAGSPGSFQITSDITFNMNVAGNARVFVLDEWVVSDGSQTFSPYTPIVAFYVNDVGPSALSGKFVDNLTTTDQDITANDGYFLFDGSISVSSGDTITLKTGLYSLAATTGFNPQATQTFTGNMFVGDINGVRLSPNVAVPEPTALGLCGLGALALLGRRRRAAARLS